MLTPVSAPSVTTRKRGVPRPGFCGRGGHAVAAPDSVAAAPSPRRFRQVGPHHADSRDDEKPQAARKATLIRIRAIVFIPCGVLGSYVACSWAALRVVTLRSGGGLSSLPGCHQSIPAVLSEDHRRPASVTVVPSTSATRRTGCPLTNVPLVDPRSTSTTWPSSTRSSEWCRDGPDRPAADQSPCPAKQRHRRLQLIGAARGHAGARGRAGDDEPRSAGKLRGRHPRQVADRLATSPASTVCPLITPDRM